MERGPQAGADQQVRCHLGRDAPDVSGPFLARVRTGCFPDGGYRVGVLPEHQEVRRWNPDVAAGQWSVARQSERPAQPVRALGARPDAELALAVAPLAVAPLAGAASAQPVAPLGQLPLALPAWQALPVLGALPRWVRSRSPPAPPQARRAQPLRMLPVPRQLSWLPLSWLAPS